MECHSSRKSRPIWPQNQPLLLSFSAALGKQQALEKEERTMDYWFNDFFLWLDVVVNNNPNTDTSQPIVQQGSDVGG